MGSHKNDLKADEDGGGNPYQHVEKTTVLQEARAFNDTTLNHRKCTHILTKLLYLLNQGEQLGNKEATDVFFAMTKLFQSKDVILRRLLYLGIKELSSMANDVIIVTSSLTKDMTGKEDMYRAAAIRALCSITDAAMLQAIERYMKQAIVDKNPAVSSAALVSSLHLTTLAPDVVKRWLNEVQETVKSNNFMVSYHGLGLLYEIKKFDRLAVVKLATKLVFQKSPLAICMLIRIAAKLIEEDDAGPDSPNYKLLMKFIKSNFGHKSEMVQYEAAHAIVNLKDNKDLAGAISVLQVNCGSPKPAVRFAAVRTLNQVAISHPAAVTACNIDLESLITDSNRSIATLAITTLLKTGAESSVERLMKQIASFVSEISDEFKVVVVYAIRALALKFPRKHSSLMNFLSAMLRDEGGLDYKASIADTIITIIEDNPEAKETGLAHLCEFIEDCEHTSLAVRILHLLGKEGPKTKQPSRYIRFIYNRVILENPTVRAAAVSAMAQFGATCNDLLENIQVLLARCQMDSDDEVRDRATYYSNILRNPDKSIYNNYILETPQLSVTSLERCLKEYLSGNIDEPFNIKTVPISSIPAQEEKEIKQKAKGVLQGTGLAKPAPISKEENFAEKLSSIPGIQSIGPLFKSSSMVELTESETEYYVRCIKHCYENHVILQFDCLNTLSDQLLENVKVQVDPSEGYDIVGVIPCPKIAYNETGTCYVIVRFPQQDLPNTIGTFGAVLKFIVKDCDPTTGVPETDEGYEEEYMLEDLEITLGDQIQKVHKANWNNAWEEAGQSFVEMEDTYSLSSMNSLDEAVKNIIQFLGLQPAERTDKVFEGKTTHTLLLAGVFRGGIDILVRAKLALADGVNMQLNVKATREDVADLIISAVG